MTQSKTVHVPLDAARWPLQREWTQLDDVCDGVFDCPHTTPAITTEGPFVVRSQDVRTGVFRADEAAHVSEETYRERIVRAEPSYGDILYSREGTYFGNAAEVPKNMRVCLGQRMVLIRPKKEKLNSRFLRLWLNSPVLSLHIHGFRDGTVAERLNMPTIRSLPVPVFDLVEQDAIASTLGTFDDKIEISHQMNSTLQTMAREIFRDWFVDFGPTRAKSEGRAAYLSPNLWALFPDALDGRGIPQGWDSSEIGKEARCVGGSTPSTTDTSLWRGGVSWATPKDLSALKSPVLLSTERTISEKGLEKIGSGLLPAGTLLLSSRAPIGYLAIAEVPVAINQGFIALVPEGRLSNVFLWQWVIANMQSILRKANGSTFQEISKASFRPLPVIVPSVSILKAFDDSVMPLYVRMRANVIESKSLGALRDFLLPRLMSGEIRVKNQIKGAL